MSDETETSETQDNANLIGVDPLAWLSEEEKASVLTEGNQVPESTLNEEQEQSIEAKETEVEQQTESTNQGSYTVDLDIAVTIRDVAELMDELSFIDSEVKEIIFECEKIEKTDAPALQLLAGYYLFANQDGKNVIWHNPSESFQHGVELLGLKGILNFPEQNIAA